MNGRTFSQNSRKAGEKPSSPYLLGTSCTHVTTDCHFDTDYTDHCPPSNIHTLNIYFDLLKKTCQSLSSSRSWLLSKCWPFCHFGGLFRIEKEREREGSDRSAQGLLVRSRLIHNARVCLIGQVFCCQGMGQVLVRWWQVVSIPGGPEMLQNTVWCVREGQRLEKSGRQGSQHLCSDYEYYEW